MARSNLRRAISHGDSGLQTLITAGCSIAVAGLDAITSYDMKPSDIDDNKALLAEAQCHQEGTSHLTGSASATLNTPPPPGIMVNAVLLYCCALQVLLCFCAIRAELDPNAVRDVPTNADFTSLSRGKTLLSAAGLLTKPTLEKGHQMSEKMMLNPELMFNAVKMDRSKRSPRRCVRHLESCFGYALPCCDPCAICYCRFFNAICYCRKIGSDCDQGKN